MLPGDRHDFPVPTSITVRHSDHPTCRELAALTAMTCGGTHEVAELGEPWVCVEVDGRRVASVWVGPGERSERWVQGNAARLAQTVRDAGFGGLRDSQVKALRQAQGLPPRYRTARPRSVEGREPLLDPAVVEEPTCSEVLDPSSNGENVP